MEKQTIIKRDLDFSIITKEEFLRSFSEDIPKAIDKHNETLGRYNLATYVIISPSPVPGPVPIEYYIHKENTKEDLERAFETLIKDPDFIDGIGYAINHYVDEEGRSLSAYSFSLDILHDEEKSIELQNKANQEYENYARFASPRD